MTVDVHAKKATNADEIVESQWTERRRSHEMRHRRHRRLEPHFQQSRNLHALRQQTALSADCVDFLITVSHTGQTLLDMTSEQLPARHRTLSRFCEFPSSYVGSEVS